MITDPLELRRAFDAAFAAAPPPQRADPRRYLIALAGDRRLALRLDELLAVLPLPALATLPRARTGLLGVGAVRGRATAVFSLAALLGGEPRRCRWLTLLAPSVAIALEELEGVTAAQAELPAATGGERRYSTHAIASGAGLVDIVDSLTLASSLSPATAGEGDSP